MPDLTSPSTPHHFAIPPPVRGSGSFSVSHSYLDKATVTDADGMALQLIAETPNDAASNYRLTDFATAAFALHRWSIGIHVGREVRRRGFDKGERQCRYWCLREVVSYSPLLDPHRPWPPPDVRAELVPLLDMAALIVFGLEGDGWRGNESLDHLADMVVAALNQPWRIVP